MIPSIATVTMGGDLPARLDAAAKAGFEAVELFDADLDAFDGDEHTVRRLVEAVHHRVQPPHVRVVQVDAHLQRRAVQPRV